MTLFQKFVVVVVCLSFWQTNAGADAGVGTELFGQGRMRLSVSGGYGELNNNGYGVLGVGVGYYLLNGLEAGLDGEAWLGSKPHIYTASPEVRYVIQGMGQFLPYVGGFYKRSFYDTLAPLDSAGGRAGLITILSPRTYVSFGLVFEKFFQCDSNLYGSCSQTYPEIGFAFSY